jgi:hypothetical protein
MPPDSPRSSKFPEEENTTGRQEILTKVLILLSELNSESDKMYVLLQNGGMTSNTRSKSIERLFNLNQIVRSIEEYLGVYHQVYSKDEDEIL